MGTKEKELITILLGVGLLIFLAIVVFRSIVKYKITQQLMAKIERLLEDRFHKELLASQIEIQEQTLQHISSEIHDNIGQLVSVMNMHLITIEKDTPEKKEEKLHEIRGMGKQLMAEIKSIAVSLNSDRIMHLGLQQSLERELQRLGKSGIYQVHFAVNGSSYRLEPEKEIILFRICQETINNIVKHAEAKNIRVTLHYSPELFNLEIADDGKGFDAAFVLEHGLAKDSTGLRNLQNRSKLINASLSVKSRPNEGTIISVSLPVQSQNPV
jgi:signal transduction histidine kinase